ncbi:hypothetical protein NP493_357g04007 [Ridgeia piscesae]|uniref:PiggyBac transposable element-derived protein domain-containing protein n=1 Tax=Ridgeia piscesae TaxID=27915 RepID=A0AAD9NVF8_RIDPI|nr:hypothetical protein NP493_357g04007 [Ridgeia piscesae]
MTRLRYEKLSQYFHCSVEGQEDPQDKVRKVRPMITRCEARFGACFQPGKNISIDEAMVKFDGRLGWKQYMPLKPAKWGMKLWCLCDAESGYCSAFSVYTGATAGNGGLDLGYRVVMGLMKKYLLSNRHVYADNYFTSVHLASDLLQADIYLCGTTRASRREFPNALAETHLFSGQSVKWTSYDGVTLTKWHDKRDVYIVSTADAGGEIVRQTRRNHQDVALHVPTCVVSYNKSMGGVDHLDQMRSYYAVGRSGKRWWKYLFWALLDIGIINACTLWKLCNRPLPSNERRFSLKTFKVLLIHEMGDPAIAARNAMAPPPMIRLTAQYTVEEHTVAEHPFVRFDVRKRACKLCQQEGRRRPSGRAIESSFGCTVCNVHLCKGCHVNYHA